MRTAIKPIVIAAMTVALGVVGFAAWVASGTYNLGADAPHGARVAGMVEYFRNRSIAAHAKDVQVPPLDDAELVATGAEHYSAMCTGCHLAPGVDSGELRAGLYPVPPDLTKRHPRSPAEAFWIIKHGLKMTAMPAWGVTHDDEAIWGLVAFVNRLPTLTVAEYRTLTGASSADHAAPAPGGQEHGAKVKADPTHRHHHDDHHHDHD